MGLDEQVDGIVDSPGLPNRRRLRSPDGLEGPELAIVVGELESSPQGLRFGAGCRSSGGDPLFQHRDLFGCQLLAVLPWRHFAGGHPIDQKAFAGFSDHDRRAGFAAGNQEPFQAEIQPPLQLVGLAMALVAVGLEDAPDVSLECQRGWCCRGERWQEADQQCGNSQDSHRGNQGKGGWVRGGWGIPVWPEESPTILGYPPAVSKVSHVGPGPVRRCPTRSARVHLGRHVPPHRLGTSTGSRQ